MLREGEARLNCGPMILASASLPSVVLTLTAAVAYALPAAAGARLSDRTARIALLAAWLLHAVVLVLGLVAEPHRFGFAPSLSVTAWLVLTVYAVERQMFPQLEARWALAGLGSAAVLLALVFPGSELHVSASPWLPLHWALGISSYGLFAAAVVWRSAPLLAGLLLGETRYGQARGPRWDHATVCSVLSWLVFASLLLG